MSTISDWDLLAEQNTEIDGIYIGEHCPARNVNNAIRAIMAAMRRYQIDNDALVAGEIDPVSNLAAHLEISFGAANTATATARISDRLTKVELREIKTRAAERLAALEAGLASDILALDDKKADRLETLHGLASIATTTALLSDRLTKVELEDAELRAAERIAALEAGLEAELRSIGSPMPVARIDEIMSREVTANA